MDLVNYKIKEVQRKIHQYDNLHKQLVQTNSKLTELGKDTMGSQERTSLNINALKMFLKSRQKFKNNLKTSKNEEEKPKATKNRAVR